MSTLTFADTHNMVAFLEKPTETKAKTVNGERQLQALVDKKKVIITETSIRSDLHLEDAGGIDCLPTATIFEELARMGLLQLGSDRHFSCFQHNQLKNKSYDEIQKLFDNEMKRVNTFIPMDLEVVKSKEGTEESSKRTEDELEFDKLKKAESSEQKAKGSRKKSLGKKRKGNEQKQESSKRQRIEDDKETDEHEEAEEDDEAEMKMHMEVVQDDEGIAIDAIPLATKPPIIVEYKIVKEGQKGFYHLIRADGSTNRYSSMIRMLQNISREDLETLWKLVKTKYGNTRPEDDYERVFWGDLKVMFEPDIKSEIWRSLQGYKVTVWKLFDSSGVHFVRFQNLHIFMLVEKRYPLTPITITNMLNKKLQADYWNEMCYQLLKLMVKQQKGQ
ncbi:hypothetical protein Tco_0157255 [Tanacetum coccineum]